MDIGCSDSQIHDKTYNWDPNSKTFFLNEIEYGGTTYFIRHLKFDSVPKWAELYAEKAREVQRAMEAGVAGGESSEPAAKRAKTEAAVQKRPAGAVACDVAGA